MNYIINPYKLPNAFNFSKNPVPFGFNIVPFADSNIMARQKLYVTLLFSFEFESPTFTELWSGAISPDKEGYALVDVANILDAKLEFYTPNINLNKVHVCKKQAGQFKLRYYLADSTGILSDQYETDAYYVYKGGVSKQDYDNSATYLNTELVTNRRPLHFHQTQERVRVDEPRWLYFIYTEQSLQATELVVHCFISLNGIVIDEETLATTQYLIMQQYQLYCMPVGFTQLGIDLNASDADEVYKYTVYLEDEDPLNLVGVTFYIDRRPFYDVQYLLYRNSLGALETQALLGEKEFGMQISGERTESLALPEMMGDVLMQTEMLDAKNIHNAVVKANTGWITRDTLLRLKDLLLNRQTYIQYGNRLKPLYVSTRGPLLHKSKDSLYSLAIEYSNAYTDENYNPDELIEFADTCPAVEFIWGGQERGGYIWVMWKLPPGYDDIEFYYTVDLTGATVYEIKFEGTTGRAEIDINSASNTLIEAFEVTIKARCVCNDEISPYSYGAYTSDLVIEGASIIAPLANDDIADLGERSIVPRVLKVGGVDANFLDNDQARNGGFVGFESVYDVSGVTPIATSQNGANVQQSGNGGILYLPTSGSIALLDEDYVYYKCNEYISTYGYMLSNVARITVPLKNAVPVVYVKMAFTDILETKYKKGGHHFYDRRGPLYFLFFKDAACTIPVDVTSLGLIVAYSVYKETYQHPPASGTLISAMAFEVLKTVAVTGFTFMADGEFWINHWTPGSPAFMTNRKIESDISNSTGQIVFVGF